MVGGLVKQVARRHSVEVPLPRPGEHHKVGQTVISKSECSLGLLGSLREILMLGRTRL